MAASGTISVGATVTGTPTVGTDNIGPFNLTTGTAAAVRRDIVDLSAGANSIAIPTGAVGVLIIPPSGNGQTLVLEGAAADTGLKIHKTNPTFLSLETSSPSTAIVLTAGGTVTGMVVQFI